MLLTKEEREKFAAYLQQDAESSDAMAKQFDKMSSPVVREMAKRERSYAAACLLIIHKLLSAEDMTL